MILLLPSPLLRNALIADAAISGVSAGLMLAGARFLDGMLGLPSPLLRFAGFALLPYVAVLIYLFSRERLASAPIWLVVAGNVLWALGCMEVFVLGSYAPTYLGTAFLILQSGTVLAFACAQWLGLRQSAPVAA
jgi:hypothetical protein